MNSNVMISVSIDVVVIITVFVIIITTTIIVMVVIIITTTIIVIIIISVIPIYSLYHQRVRISIVIVNVLIVVLLPRLPSFLLFFLPCSSSLSTAGAPPIAADCLIDSGL